MLYESTRLRLPSSRSGSVKRDLDSIASAPRPKPSNSCLDPVEQPHSPERRTMDALRQYVASTHPSAVAELAALSGGVPSPSYREFRSSQQRTDPALSFGGSVARTTADAMDVERREPSSGLLRALDAAVSQGRLPTLPPDVRQQAERERLSPRLRRLEGSPHAEAFAMACRPDCSVGSAARGGVDGGESCLGRGALQQPLATGGASTWQREGAAVADGEGLVWRVLRQRVDGHTHVCVEWAPDTSISGDPTPRLGGRDPLLIEGRRASSHARSGGHPAVAGGAAWGEGWQSSPQPRWSLGLSAGLAASVGVPPRAGATGVGVPDDGFSRGGGGRGRSGSMPWMPSHLREAAATYSTPILRPPSAPPVRSASSPRGGLESPSGAAASLRCARPSASVAARSVTGVRDLEASGVAVAVRPSVSTNAYGADLRGLTTPRSSRATTRPPLSGAFGGVSVSMLRTRSASVGRAGSAGTAMSDGGADAVPLPPLPRLDGSISALSNQHRPQSSPQHLSGGPPASMSGIVRDRFLDSFRRSASPETATVSESHPPQLSTNPAMASIDSKAFGTPAVDARSHTRSFSTHDATRPSASPPRASQPPVSGRGGYGGSARSAVGGGTSFVSTHNTARPSESVPPQGGVGSLSFRRSPAPSDDSEAASDAADSRTAGRASAVPSRVGTSVPGGDRALASVVSGAGLTGGEGEVALRSTVGASDFNSRSVTNAPQSNRSDVWSVGPPPDARRGADAPRSVTGASFRGGGGDVAADATATLGSVNASQESRRSGQATRDGTLQSMGSMGGGARSDEGATFVVPPREPPQSTRSFVSSHSAARSGTVSRPSAAVADAGLQSSKSLAWGGRGGSDAPASVESPRRHVTFDSENASLRVVTGVQGSGRAVPVHLRHTSAVSSVSPDPQIPSHSGGGAASMRWAAPTASGLVYTRSASAEASRTPTAWMFK